MPPACKPIPQPIIKRLSIIQTSCTLSFSSKSEAKRAKIPTLIIRDIIRASSLEFTPFDTSLPAKKGQKSIGVVRLSIKTPLKEAEKLKTTCKKVGK